ncbi:MAG: hypothetical protein WDO19_20265 [Bacteroidota bacterium]
MLMRFLKVHELLPVESLSVSKIKIQQYGAVTRQNLAAYRQVANLNIDEIDMFENWCAGKNKGSH